jgi:formylglycine-generating enzyme required for sulfatase activity
LKDSRELLNFGFNVAEFTKRVAKPIQDKTIAQKLENISRKHNSRGQLPKAETIDKVYRNFCRAAELDKVDVFQSPVLIRRLVWAFNYRPSEKSPRIVDMPQFDQVMDILNESSRASLLMGVLNSLLQLWEHPNADKMRQYLSVQLGNYDGKRRAINQLKEQAKYFCSENGPTQLALDLLRNDVSLVGVWEYLEFDSAMRHYEFFGRVGKAYSNLINKKTGVKLIPGIMSFLAQRPEELYCAEIASNVIEVLGTDSTVEERTGIQNFAMQKWQDPRLPGGSVRWKDISEEATQIFTRWITQEDLRFFFDVVAKHCNDPKFADRRDFWLQYIEHISMCRPILRTTLREELRSDNRVRRYMQQRRPAELSGGNRDQHGFLIRMGNHIFVEFSTAAACRVFDVASCPFKLDDYSYRMSDLRSDMCIDRFPHQGQWQYKIQRWIQFNCLPLHDQQAKQRAAPQPTQNTVPADLKILEQAVDTDEAKVVERIEWEKEGTQMVLIPAGSFEMGDHFNEGDSDEKPVHKIALDAFYMDIYEVTVGQFSKFLKQSGYTYRGNWSRVAEYSSGDAYPMVLVTWNDAAAYAKWAGKRLATEAEWEYAARGGLVGKRYPWGNNDPTPDKAHYDSGQSKTKAVGNYPPNGYGLYDMAGNVWEWCVDRYGSGYYENSPTKNPPGVGTGTLRVARGGDWDNDSTSLRVASRAFSPPDARYGSIGFRCVSGLD